MKKQLIFGSIIIILGLLIALSPQIIFPVCSLSELNPDCGDSCACGSSDASSDASISIPICHWSARAEIGTGAIIIALGICILLFLNEAKTILGLSIGIFFSGINSLLIPHALIGGCNMTTMQCQRVAFPALSIICIVLLLVSLTNIIYLSKIKDKG